MHIVSGKMLKKVIFFSIIIAFISYLFIKNTFFDKENFLNEIPSYVEFTDKSIIVEEDEKNDLISKEFKDNDISFRESLSIKEINLKEKVLSVRFSDGSIWKSAENHLIQNFLYFDIDNDKSKELILLVWRKGKYGKIIPFWEKENDLSFSQHIFIYDFERGTFKPIWMSSYVSILIKDFFEEDYNLLKVLGYDGSRTLWRWTGFGINYVSNCKFDFDEKLDGVESKLTINVFGDNLIHSSICKYALNKNNNFDFLYENIVKENDSSDISVLNNETMLVKDKALYSSYPKFGIPIEVGKAVVKAGFDVVMLANNHSLDKEMIGINDTYEFYKENDICCLGIKNYKDSTKPYVLYRKNNIDIAMFNYTYSASFDKKVSEKYPYICVLDDENKIRNELHEARKKADVIIVFVHWGDDYKTKINSFQEKFARLFLEESVDIVIGTHPHVLQKTEILKNSNGKEMFVYYSLGNFVSAQNYIETMLGGEARFTIYKTKNGMKIADINLRPVVTHQEKGRVSAYMLDDYDETLAERHRLKYKNGKEFINQLKSIFERSKYEKTIN